MKRLVVIMAVVVFAIAGQVNAELIANGDFEANFEGWGTWGSGSGSGTAGGGWQSGAGTIAETGGSDGGKYAVLDTHFMDGISEDWGWVWLGVWTPDPPTGANMPITSGQKLAIDGYAIDLEAAGTPVNLVLEWRDADGVFVDLNGDGEINNDDREQLVFDIVGDDNATWEQIATQHTVPVPLGEGTIVQFSAMWWNGTPGSILGLDQLSIVIVDSVLLGDVNLDGIVNGLDVDPFVDRLLNGPNQAEADMNEDGEVNGLDVDPFVAAIVGGGVQQIPEPSALLLCIIALGVVGGWRKWKRAA
jgi:hypothetical protein